jgi:hypothetical protein
VAASSEYELESIRESAEFTLYGARQRGNAMQTLPFVVLLLTIDKSSKSNKRWLRRLKALRPPVAL